jgi:DNA-binding IclR family transcriptional regulator
MRRSQGIRGSTSAPTARVLDVVELLARAGKDQLRFSDVARELGLTQATSPAILKTLCDRGWACRDPVDKTFSLGPALAVVAARTDTARPLAHAARSAVLELSHELGYAGSVVERFGDSLVITAFESDQIGDPAGIPGDRIPYAPPFGVAFAAWDPEEEQRTWVKRGGTSAALEERLNEVLARTRARGFDVDWTTPALANAAQLVGMLQMDAIPPKVREMMDQLLIEFTTIGFLSDDDPARRAQPIATIAAPVFDEHQRVALIMCLHPFQALSARRVGVVGRRLIRATGAIGANPAVAQRE